MLITGECSSVAPNPPTPKKVERVASLELHDVPSSTRTARPAPFACPHILKTENDYTLLQSVECKLLALTAPKNGDPFRVS